MFVEEKRLKADSAKCCFILEDLAGSSEQLGCVFKADFGSFRKTQYVVQWRHKLMFNKRFVKVAFWQYPCLAWKVRLLIDELYCSQKDNHFQRGHKRHIKKQFYKSWNVQPTALWGSTYETEIKTDVMLLKIPLVLQVFCPYKTVWHNYDITEKHKDSPKFWGENFHLYLRQFTWNQTYRPRGGRRKGERLLNE